MYLISGRGFGGNITSHSEPDLRVKPYSPRYAQRDRREDPRRGSATAEVSVPDIYLYTISREEGRNVRQEFSRRIKEEYCYEQVFENVEIKDLSKDEVKKMYTAGQNHEVSVFLDKGISFYDHPELFLNYQAFITIDVLKPLNACNQYIIDEQV